MLENFGFTSFYTVHCNALPNEPNIHSQLSPIWKTYIANCYCNNTFTLFQKARSKQNADEEKTDKSISDISKKNEYIHVKEFIESKMPPACHIVNTKTKVLPTSETTKKMETLSVSKKKEFYSAKIIAWYINPAIYVLFCIFYFTLALFC